MVQQKTQLGSQIAYIYHMSKAKEARGDNSREISCLVLRGELESVQDLLIKLGIKPLMKTSGNDSFFIKYHFTKL